MNPNFQNNPGELGRDNMTPGNINPDDNQKEPAQEKTLTPEESSIPSVPTQVMAILRFKQQVSHVLAGQPDGHDLDKYYGITTGNPEQTKQEQQDSDALIDKLKGLAMGEENLADIIRDALAKDSTSKTNAEALRALIEGPKKEKWNW